jgi:predicted permease
VAIAVLSLALGVGVNSIVFSLVDGMFLRPLPVSDPSSLVRIEWQSVDGRTSAMAWADLQALRESGGAFGDIAAQNRRGGLIGTGGDVELTLVTIVSDNYFPLLGIGPARGRLFRANLDETLEHEPAVAISDGLWRRRFAAEPGLVGRTLRLNNRTFTVVGILPPSFRGLSRGVMTDIWVPVSSWRAMGNAREFEERVVGQFEPIGRLRAGANLGAAQAQLDVFAGRLQQEQPEASRGRRLVVRTQSNFESGGRGRLLSALLLAITGLLVVIACANVAQLLLALSETRRHEMAIRQALGASRGRLVRQLLTESALLAAAGGVAAMLVPAWLIPLLPSLLPPGPSFVQYDIRLDLRVVIATIITCTLTVLFFGLVPAVREARADLNSVIKTGGWNSRRRFSGRNLLVVSQAMLGVTLLSAAGLLALSFARAQEANPEFDTGRNMLVIMASLSGPADRRAATGDEIAARVSTLPGVKRVAYCRRFPMASSGGGATRDVVIPGREVPPGYLAGDWWWYLARSVRVARYNFRVDAENSRNDISRTMRSRNTPMGCLRAEGTRDAHHERHTEGTGAETENRTRRGRPGDRRSQRTSDRSVECGERNPREAGSFNASYSLSVCDRGPVAGGDQRRRVGADLWVWWGRERWFRAQFVKIISRPPRSLPSTSSSEFRCSS